MTTLPAGEPKSVIYELTINAEPGPMMQSWVATSPFPSIAVGDYIAPHTIGAPSALKIRVTSIEHLISDTDPLTVLTLVHARAEA